MVGAYGQQFGQQRRNPFGRPNSNAPLGQGRQSGGFGYGGNTQGGINRPQERAPASAFNWAGAMARGNQLPTRDQRRGMPDPGSGYQPPAGTRDLNGNLLPPGIGSQPPLRRGMPDPGAGYPGGASPTTGRLTGTLPMRYGGTGGNPYDSGTMGGIQTPGGGYTGRSPDYGPPSGQFTGTLPMNVGGQGRGTELGGLGASGGGLRGNMGGVGGNLLGGGASTYDPTRAGYNGGYGAGGGYGQGSQSQYGLPGGPRYDPRNYVTIDPMTGERIEMDRAEIDRYARLYGYNPEGSPTWDRQRFNAEQTGQINGQQTLAGRQQGLSEQLGLRGMNVTEANQRLNQLVQTGQLSIAQARQALDELSNQQQYGLQGRQVSLSETLGLGNLSLDQARVRLNERIQSGQLSVQQANQAMQELQGQQQFGLQVGAQTGQYGGQTNLAGRQQNLAETQNQQDWQFRLAQMSANPANAATMAALSGRAPWQTGGASGAPGAAPGGGVPTGQQFNSVAYGRMNPSEQAALGSFTTAAFGQTPDDWRQQMAQYSPAASAPAPVARW